MNPAGGLRAPDPTLTALSAQAMVQVDLYRPLPVAHQDSDGDRTPCGLGLDPDYAEVERDLVFMGADTAAFIAVPCRKCFPDASEPGHLPDCTDLCPFGDMHDYLAWQVR